MNIDFMTYEDCLALQKHIRVFELQCSFSNEESLAKALQTKKEKEHFFFTNNIVKNGQKRGNQYNYKRGRI